MPQPTGTFSRYDAIGIREALSETIYNISPDDTPLMSNAGRETVSNTYFEWQTDALEAVDTSNFKIEGDDVGTFDSVTPTTRLGNYTQISDKTLVLSGTLEAVNKAGRKSELSYQMAKRSRELKIDMEAMALNNNARVAGNDTTARETGSLLSFIKTNTSIGATGANPAGDGTNARTDGTQRAFTETLLKAVISQVWASGGSLKMLMVGAFNKQAASAFTGIADIRYNATGAKPTTIIGAADIYVSDFGNLSVVPNRWMRSRDALLVDPEYISFCFLRPFFTQELAKTGDNMKRQLLVEWGLKVKNEKALGGVFDLTTS